MNKKNNRKGFTTVELVIVIAVIAILATVLIPTFSNLINNANDSKYMQAAKNAHTAYVTDFDYSKGALPVSNILIEVTEDNVTTYFVVVGNQFSSKAYASDKLADALKAFDSNKTYEQDTEITGEAVANLPDGVSFYTVKEATPAQGG